MKKTNWSEYEKYLVMVEGIVGVKTTYSSFLDFKRVKNVLIQISKGGSGTYLYEGEIYKRPITQLRATKILEKIEKYNWDDDIRKIAHQINAYEMLSPNKK